jgi:uncharacterized RDD family membrane protein YckC
MRCPRCQAETGAAAIRCGQCGAPLAVGDEPAPRPLDRELDLDRRGAGEPRPPPAGPARPPQAPATPEDLEAAGQARVLAAPPGTVLELRRGGSARRVAAWLVDGLPFVAAPFLVAAALGGGAALLPPLLAVAALASFTYQALSHALAGATLGKWLARLRVVGPDGERPGPGRSALRAAVAVAGTALLGAGPLLGLFTRSGRALHDLAAGTAVVDAP